MHDLVIVGAPLFAILAGMLFSRHDIKELRTEMRTEIKDLRTEMRTEMKDLRAEVRDLRSEMKDFRQEVIGHLGRIDADLRQFYHLTGSLEARMDSLEKR